jgi:hypothetical protein
VVTTPSLDRDDEPQFRDLEADSAYQQAQRLGLKPLDAALAIQLPDYLPDYLRVCPPLDYMVALNHRGGVRAGLIALGYRPENLPHERPAPRPKPVVRPRPYIEPTRLPVRGPADPARTAQDAIDAGQGPADGQSDTRRPYDRRQDFLAEKGITGRANPQRHSQTPEGQRERRARRAVAEGRFPSFRVALERMRRNPRKVVPNASEK